MGSVEHMSAVDAPDDDELLRLRDRQHKIADVVQAHDGKLIEHGIMINLLQREVLEIRSTAATSEQLQSAVALLTLKLETVAKALSPIQRGIYWAVGLILAAVLVAILALVIRQPDSRDSLDRLPGLLPAGQGAH